ncbi:CopG family transcriptional regulator [Macrococcoides caseolyticum]|uniref:CopG family transcriptional regulator n=1 Tax=Macrococcoides caseolyticum TaxID=69966 RepID=A0ACC9MNY6_9STAP|nr:CopG family transcriptional regulator [Macrococcus caseolyticus]PKE38402.1 CopG family transcriptional regulator [Macrococcus caseolyticus]PKE55547.1 CopG family transcriptional regulator [Macrococcus caseolyticus]PKF39954.1 CopG family transcriptional regulator [Macrococcus caseolyticus]QYA36604.1 CopG family transcriptional regulator [Macrococcus caseolyticus]
MAFEFNSEKSEKIKEALKKDSVDNESYFLKEISEQPIHEIKQRYNIMLDPSIKKKADKIAKEKNFKSTSSFINELIKNL